MEPEAHVNRRAYAELNSAHVPQLQPAPETIYERQLLYNSFSAKYGHAIRLISQSMAHPSWELISVNRREFINLHPFALEYSI